MVALQLIGFIIVLKDKNNPFQIMSTLHHEDLLWDIYDEVVENFPYLDEEKQIEIANKRFEEMCQ